MYLLPTPHFVDYQSDFFYLRYDTEIIIHSHLESKEFNYAAILKKQIEDSLHFSLPITKSDQNRNNSITLRIEDKLEPEEYKLIIIKEQVHILGGNSVALLYGIQTLRQIIAQNGAMIPCLVIKDYPEILNRGFYHDVTRGRIPTLKSLKALADKMSYYKLNQLQLYVEHSFLFRDFSEVWRDDTPLTAEEIMEFDQYCRSLNIELVPSIASFGHLYKVLSTKTFSSLCELEGSDKRAFSFVGRMEHHTVDTTNPKSLEMIQKMLMEYIPLFSSKQFNICSDETFDLGKGKSSTLADSNGTDRMYVDFLKKLCDFIELQGKRPMFWGDIILSQPEAMNELPKDIICLNWDYNRDLTDTNIKKLYDIGATQYLCPGVWGWNHFINNLESAYANISVTCKYAHQYNAAGILNTDWGDYGHINPPEFSTTGMIYGASFSWNSNQLSFKEINKQISFLEYKDSSGNFVQIINEMASQDDSLWSFLVEYKEKKQKKIRKEIVQQAYLANDKLEKAVEKMYCNITHMDSSVRGVVKAYLIMAKGLMLFYTVLGIVYEKIHKKDSINQELIVDPLTMASNLEYWFMDYKELWRSQSKEGELYRIQEIVFWYADYLRNLT